MPGPLPKELRDRFARLIEEGLSGREASRRLQVSAATGARWRRKIHASGTAPIAPMGRPPGSGKLVPHVMFFRELVAQD
ncbi:helix-turn-helix domain-containing protein [Yoonia sp. R2-816]|uniref:helix-turn-helix domain-containing protein n=1 Tax=Yoonia sp. R2-816 TaxID=3342638 RepID=UPI003727AE32